MPSSQRPHSENNASGQSPNKVTRSQSATSSSGSQKHRRYSHGGENNGSNKRWCLVMGITVFACFFTTPVTGTAACLPGCVCVCVLEVLLFENSVSCCYASWKDSFWLTSFLFKSLFGFFFFFWIQAEGSKRKKRWASSVATIPFSSSQKKKKRSKNVFPPCAPPKKKERKEKTKEGKCSVH